jgi:hypothetical protein
MPRISKILIAYNLGVGTMYEFLLGNGYLGSLSLSTMIEEPFLSIIENAFGDSKATKEKANAIMLPEATERIVGKLSEVPVGFAKRIAVEADSRITYRDVFGECLWGAKNIKCVDPCIRKEHQFDNLVEFICLVRSFSINPVRFELITCSTSPLEKTEIDIPLKNVQAAVKNLQIEFMYSVENIRCFHDRHIFVDNKFIIDLSRGLDVFQPNSKADQRISKACTIFITRLGNPISAQNGKLLIPPTG